jgi:hypothetical protein
MTFAVKISHVSINLFFTVVERARIYSKDYSQVRRAIRSREYFYDAKNSFRTALLRTRTDALLDAL